MSHADMHLTDTPSRQPQPGAKTIVEPEVEAKQGTDTPRNMPVVLLVSTVGAAVALWVVWSVFFAG